MEIGTGAYGRVHACGDMAVKIIPSDQLESAVREVSIIGGMDHPNVIRINRIESDGDIKIYMDRYECDLAQFMRGDYLTGEMLDIIRQIFVGLSYIHGCGVIHADIKPSNILIMRGDIKVALCDFGISILINSGYHQSRIQSPGYRAPEVNIGRAVSRYCANIDVWSAGCILLQMLTRTPALGDDDPSINACRMLRLPDGGNRTARMRLLRGLRKTDMDRICRGILHGARPHIPNSQLYERLLAGCLHPNNKKRISATDALKILDSGVDIPAYIHPAPTYRFRAIDWGILPHLDRMGYICATIALNICGEIGDCTADIEYASIYIAMCVVKLDVSAIYKYVDRQKVEANARYILANVRPIYKNQMFAMGYR